MRITAVAAGVLALVLGLSACGGQSGTGSDGPTLFGDAQELVRAASAKTDEVRTAKFSMSGSAAGQELTGTGEGRFGPDTALSVTTTVAGQTQEVRIVGGVVYLKVPEAALASTGGKPWATFAPDSELARTLGAALDQAEANDPAKTLEQVQRAGTITRSELTTLDGKPVSHYWVTIEVAKVTDELGGTGLPAPALEQLKSSDLTYPMELWLDEDQLPVRITQDTSAIMRALGAPAEVAQGDVTMDYHDWGTPVSVEAPPADQVGELRIGG